MKTFPYHALSRRYTLGTPRKRIIDSGIATMQLGSGLLRARDELGQALWAWDLRFDGLTAADVAILEAFYTDHQRGVTPFYWADPVSFLTYQARFDPAAPPQIAPHAELPERYNADIALLPVIPTAAESMLAAHYKLNDTDADTIVIDASSYGHTGTAARNASLMTTAGKIGTALAFNGIDDYIAVTSADDLNVGTGDFAIAFWLKLSGSDHEGERIINKRSAINDIGWEIYCRYSAGNAVLGWYANDGSAYASRTLVVPDLGGNTWRHIVVNVTRSGEVEAYVNGQRMSTGTMTGCPGSLSNDESLHIGCSTYGQANKLIGVLDDMRLYKRPLTPLEIQAIYNSGNGTEAVIVA